ncbi:uncharacterized protein LOC9629958 [Selaginella moellendorffii]|uniref:uncharacterized protein LOC9629958 n=1 Tax=Selaginella moellendorffii TaxID=88036 RepID=UPI000D1CFAF9|nr:uncharacterized protein LOC9629958 [Selaginella moellendorffii]|eukprot:XP_024536055.1 uncharacterized protein LOC9629958 [Selaginella moellendorffii]
MSSSIALLGPCGLVARSSNSAVPRALQIDRGGQRLRMPPAIAAARLDISETSAIGTNFPEALSSFVSPSEGLELTELTAISPLDGRYANKVKFLRTIFSEYALIRYRVIVEVQWLLKLSQIPELKEVPPFTDNARSFLLGVLADFNVNDGAAVKNFERVTNHDVKAIEYFLKGRIKDHPELSKVLEFIHFGCTSEDINNLAYALMLLNGREHLLKKMDEVISAIRSLAHKHANVPMLSRTHGQPASPSTIGKEMANFCYRMELQRNQVASVSIKGKMAGAVGNYNAHCFTYPEIKWEAVAESFVTSLGVDFNPYTTQIEPHDCIAELFDAVRRFGNILEDFDRDMWAYISLGYFKQKVVPGEVGSSTMPHKVNPIDFENSEGNLGLAKSWLSHLGSKLQVSRMQRDLTDSTVLRQIGQVLALCVLSYDSTLRGINKLEVDEAATRRDLDATWEVLAEPIQMMMRRYGIEKPYEKLKEFTRGAAVTKESMREFIETLDLPEAAKERLRLLTPHTYCGKAAELASNV